MIAWGLYTIRDEYPRNTNLRKMDDMLLCVYATRPHVQRAKHHLRQNFKMVDPSQDYRVDKATLNSHYSQEGETMDGTMQDNIS